MEKEVEDYLLNVSRLLNGQLRGAINLKAREENLELIQLTIGDVFERAYGLGRNVKTQQEALEQLKKDLKDDNEESEDDS